MKLFIVFLTLLFSRQKNLDLNHLSADFDPTPPQAIFNNLTVSSPLAQTDTLPPIVLGQNTADKRIEIDLTNQRLYAYEDNNLVYNFLISSGKWGRTPTGTFQIWTKLRYTKMEGGSKALNTYYYLPNVPYTMFFYSDEVPKSRGFGLHGTYWHDNFGHPMSHGCINMKTEEVAQLFYWAQPDLQGQRSIYASADNPGTTITIFGQTPDE
ncbi:MAG: L,D-transpeptidase [Candidatus Beckwithbacteria bacterium]